MDQTINRIKTLLGFASKSRQLITGVELTISEMKRKKIDFVFVATDVSANTFEKIQRAAEVSGVKLYRIFTMDELSDAIGKDNRVIAGVLDKQMASKIKEYLAEFNGGVDID